MRILFIAVFIFFSFFISPSYAVYNPASGEDDIVLIDDTQEVKMGNSLAENVEKQFGLLEDVNLQLRVNSIGQKLVSVCDRQNIAYSFRVLAGEELKEDQRHNAFALPGGYVYIFREMAQDTESDDELASVLAHEIGHIVARHSVKKLQSSIGLGGLSLLGSIAATDSRSKKKSSVAIAQLMMEYSREAEFEADKLSIKYLKAAGFNPKAASDFMNRMLEKQLSGKINYYHYFRTHPYTTERLAAINKEISGKVAFDDYINTPLGRGESYW